MVVKIIPGLNGCAAGETISLPLLAILTMYLFLFFVTVVLLDTTGEEKLEWTRYPYGPQASTPGVSIQTCSIFLVLAVA